MFLKYFDIIKKLFLAFINNNINIPETRPEMSNTSSACTAWVCPAWPCSAVSSWLYDALQQCTAADSVHCCTLYTVVLCTTYTVHCTLLKVNRSVFYCSLYTVCYCKLLYTYVPYKPFTSSHSSRSTIEHYKLYTVLSIKGELLFSSVEQVTLIHVHWLRLSSKMHHILTQ